MRELDEGAKVGPVPGSTTSGPVGHVRRRGDRAEDHVIATDPQVTGRVRGMERELRRGRRHERLDHLAVEPHPFAVDRGAGLSPHAQRLGVQEVHPGLFEHSQRREMDRFQLVVRHHAGRLETAPVQVPGRLGRCLGSGRPLSSTATAWGFAHARVSIIRRTGPYPCRVAG